MSTRISAADRSHLRTVLHGVTLRLARATQTATWLPVGYLGLVTVAAIVPVRTGRRSNRPRLVIVVAAHNEGAYVGQTVRSLLNARYTSARRRVIVVAHNCSDDTARRAAAAGAEVWVRDEPSDLGKGAPLSWALELLLQLDDWDGVVVVDADTTVDTHFLEAVGGEICSGSEAIQGERRVANSDSSVVARLAAVSMAVNSTLRPRGRARLGATAKLLGNGMAFTRSTIERVHFNPAHLIEDVDYWFRLTEAGIVVKFRADAIFHDLMPADLASARRQRGRWQQGRAQVVREWRRRGVWGGLRNGDPRQIEAAVSELVFPPLAATVGAVVVPAMLSRALGERSLTSALLQMFVLMGHVSASLVLVRADRRTWLALGLGPLAVAWKAMVRVAVSGPGRERVWEPTRIGVPV